MGTLPLEGLKIVDLCTVLMGPLCTQILADHGAEIIKVEPVTGDTTRWIGPCATPGMGPLFMNLNRGKKAMAVDLKDSRCQQALRNLIAGADVVVHNLRPKVAAKRGLDFESLTQVNPKIVFCNLYGYGKDGPYRDRPAYDDLIQGACGIPYLQTVPGGTEPRYAPVNLADRMVGVYAASAIPIALLAAGKSGQAQKVELPMYEVLASMVLADHLYGQTNRPAMSTPGYPRLLSKDRRPFQTRDGYICVAIYNDSHWKRFLPAIGRDELLTDKRFATLNARMANIGFISTFTSEILAGRTTQDWMAFFDELDIPVSPMNSLESLMSDPQTVASKVVIEQDHPTEGKVRAISNPLVWSDSRTDIGFAPKLGEHTMELLTRAGLSEATVRAMAEEGVVSLGEASRKDVAANI